MNNSAKDGAAQPSQVSAERQSQANFSQLQVCLETLLKQWPHCEKSTIQMAYRAALAATPPQPPGAEATPAVVGKCEMCSQPIDDQVAFLNRELANFRRNAGYAWREGMMEAMKIFGDSITYREATKAIMERVGERGREAEAYASSSRVGKPSLGQKEGD